jgi:phospholipid/cholesterol/gamma-HCH transport system ATP-binding protein
LVITLSKSSQEVAVDIRNLVAGYGEKVILHDVSLTVPKGEIVALIGGSGCGKSTVIRAIVGLLTPFSGTVRVFGEDPHAMGEQERLALLRRMGMLFQNGALLGSMTVGDNVGLPLKEHTRLPDAVIRRVVESKLALVGLPGAGALLPAELSGGMRKRASLSRAIVMDPELLVCDEPSAGLDPIVAAGIDVTLRDLQRRLGMTMIVVTHELASIELIADWVVMLSTAGRVLAQGTVPEMRKSEIPEVRDFFARKPKGEGAMTQHTLLDVLEGP